MTAATANILTDAHYKAAFKLAYNQDATGKDMAGDRNEWVVLQLAADHPDFKKLRHLKKALDLLGSVNANYLHKDSEPKRIGLTGTMKVGGEVDRELRQRYDLKLGEQVWKNPVNGEVVRGTKGQAFKARCEESAVRTGWAKQRNDIDW